MVRAALNIVGATMASKGIASGTEWESISGGVLALAAVVWGFWHHANPKPEEPPQKTLDKKTST